MLTNQRKTDLKQKLAKMIGEAWRRDSYDPGEMTFEEHEYIEKCLNKIREALVSR